MEVRTGLLFWRAASRRTALANYTALKGNANHFALTSQARFASDEYAILSKRMGSQIVTLKTFPVFQGSNM